MAHLSYVVKAIIFLAPIFAGTVSIAADPFIDTILKKYGAESFNKAQEIRFTFNAKALALTKQRRWLWKPLSDSVTRIDKKISYSRKSMNAEEKILDADFINDQYWLTFAFHLGTDKGVEIMVDPNLSLSPINQESLRRVVVNYPKQVGYSPGDTYELFADEQGLIKEWVYRKGGIKKGLKWTWEKHETFSGVLLSQEHRGFIDVFFTDIQIH